MIDVVVGLVVKFGVLYLDDVSGLEVVEVMGLEFAGVDVG